MLRVLRWRRRTRSRSSIRATALPIADDETPSCRPATVKLRASAARTKAFSDPGCPSADPPLRTIESDMFRATAHCSSFGSLSSPCHRIRLPQIGASFIRRPPRPERRWREGRVLIRRRGWDKMSTTEVNRTSNSKNEDLDVIIVGAGFAGFYLLDRLRGMGMTVQVFEAGDGPGGVWYWNCLPWGSRRFSRSNVSVFARRPLARLEVQRALSLLAGNSRVFPLRERETRPQSGHSLQQTRE